MSAGRQNSRLKKGIDLLDEKAGVGRAAAKGDRVVYNLKIFLNKGDEVPLNQRQAEYLPDSMLRTEEGYRFVNHEAMLGKRQAIPGIEHSLAGMKLGGYRKVQVSPHLAYRDRGLNGLIPANAVLVIELWLRELIGP